MNTIKLTKTRRVVSDNNLRFGQNVSLSNVK